MIRALIGNERLSGVTARLAPDRPTGLDCCPLLKPDGRFPISDLAYPLRLEPRPTNDAAFFQALLEGVTRIERLAYGRLAELGTLQLASMRSVGGGARNAIWTSMRKKVLGVPFLPARSVEAAVGTASLVRNAIKEAR